VRALGAELLVGHRDVVAHPEDAKELVQRRRPEALVDRCAEVGRRRGPPEGGQTGAHRELVDVGELLARGNAGRGRGVAAGGVVREPVVGAQPADELPLGDGREDVLQEGAGDELLAAGDAAAQEAGGRKDILVGLALDPAEVGARQQQVRAEAVAPLKRAAGRGGGHRLVQRQRLRVAVDGLGGERAAELLQLQERVEGPRAAVRCPHAAARHQISGGGVVNLKSGAVAPVLVVVVAAEEEGEPGH
jgi:hypothetical protein